MEWSHGREFQAMRATPVKKLPASPSVSSPSVPVADRGGEEVNVGFSDLRTGSSNQLRDPRLGTWELACASNYGRQRLTVRRLPRIFTPLVRWGIYALLDKAMLASQRSLPNWKPGARELRRH